MGRLADVRYGMLGTGYVSEWWLDSVRASPHVQVLAVASREHERARAFAAEHGVARAYQSYAALLADPDVDAVYVALRTELHEQWTLAAIRAGKHVLCEKPLASDGDGARRLHAAAREAGVVLCEGFPYRYSLHCQRVAQLLAAGAIGRPLLLRTHMSYVRADSVRRDAAGRARDPLVGGGALADSGCYCVSIARLVYGRAPDAVQAAAVYGAHGRDETLLASLEYGDALAQLSCSFVSAGAPRTEIYGSNGVLETEFQNVRAAGESATILLRRSRRFDAPVERLSVPGCDGFRAEAETVASLAAGEPRSVPGMPAEESIDVAVTLAAIARAARRGVRVPLAMPGVSA